MRKLKPLVDNVIIELKFKKLGSIIIPDSKSKVKNNVVEKQTVYSVGPDVKNLKEGETVLIERMILQDSHRQINPNEDPTKMEEGYAYVLIKEEEVMGRYE